jgi:hypothetical protein
LLSIESSVDYSFPPVSPAISQSRTFSGSAMAAAKIDGTAIAKNIRQGLKDEIDQIQATNPRFKPNLVIFQGKESFSNKMTEVDDTNMIFLQWAIAPIPVGSSRDSPERPFELIPIRYLCAHEVEGRPRGMTSPIV